MVKNSPLNAGDAGSIPGQGAKIPHDTGSRHKYHSYQAHALQSPLTTGHSKDPAWDTTQQLNSNHCAKSSNCGRTEGRGQWKQGNEKSKEDSEGNARYQDTVTLTRKPLMDLLLDMAWLKKDL